eukprot:TRINITY_DN3857_c0_g1_i11.p1 TRINITY_DN3857_c0_g1~~TRINITY_DN3857_c0_g1_i11.p1  ORF type:complete len:431 (+),score=47.71 TRINITY_DN3857_c0_g1_i11:119-1411(+)
MFAVIVLFGFLGACVKGMTGFGQAIVVLTLWSLLNAYGVDVGSLKQVLMCDSFSSLPTAIPFMVLTNVCENGKIGLTLPIAIVMNIMSPIGAWFVANLEVQILLVCLAVTLVAVVTLLNIVPLVMQSQNSPQRKITQDEHIHLLQIPLAHDDDDDDDDMQISGSSSDSRSDQENQRNDILANTKNSELELQLLKPQKLSQSKNAFKSINFDEFTAADNFSATNESCFGMQLTRFHNLYQNTKKTLHFCFKIIFHIISLNTTYQHDSNDDSTNLNFQFRQMDECQQQQQYFNFEDHLIVTATGGWLKGLKYILMCSIFAGLMGSMFAIPDPPLIIMTQILHISKQNIRATQSTLGLLNPRPLFYVAFGLFRMEDMHMYIMYTIATMLGLSLGSWGSARVSQVWFMRVLTMLVMLSTVTLIWQSFYVLPQNK